MDEVTIRDGATSIAFRSVQRPSGGDTTDGDFIVDLVADGLQVSQPVHMIEMHWQGLAGFFDDLAESWRGWEGSKVWESIHHDLRLEVTADTRGHVNLRAIVRNGPLPTWKVELEDVRVDAGEDLVAIAREVRTWVGTQPT